MSRARSLLWFGLLLCGCSAPGTGREAREISAGAASAWAELSEPGRFSLAIGIAPEGGVRQRIAHANGCYLALEEDLGFRLSLPFVGAEIANGSLLLRLPRHGPHEILVSVRPAGGALRVEVRDSVGLRSRIRELALDYFLDSDSPVVESYAPHLHPGPDHVAGESTWTLPLAFARAGGNALALLPDTSAPSPLAQGLRVDPDLRRIRHGLFSISADGPFDRISEGKSIQGETLAFCHRLLVSEKARAQSSLDSVVDRLFAENGLPWLEGPPDPRSPSWQQTGDELASAAAGRWRAVRAGGEDLGLLVDREGGTRAFCTWRSQPLRVAEALHMLAQLREDPELERKAEAVVRLILSVPCRGGMTPCILDVPKDGDTLQGGSDDGSLGHAGWIRTLDSTVSAYWLLRASSWMPDLREAILEAARETARFLLANQLPSGGFPSFFDSEYLAPSRQLLYDEGAEGAGAALFLAEYGAATGEALALAAARRALDRIERESRGGLLGDFETRAAGRALAEPADGSLGWLFAAMAALRLAEVERGDAASRPRELAGRFLHRLARFQQIRERRWHDEDRVGAFGRTTADRVWNDDRTALACEVFAKGYEVIGDPIWLRRAALASRAMRSGGSVLPGAVHQRLSGILGQGVVDVGNSCAQALDAFWLANLRVEGDELSFDCLSDRDLCEVRVAFRNLGRRTGLLIRVNGSVLGFVGVDQLHRGIPVAVRRIPRFRFRPGGELAQDRPWPVRVRSEGPTGGEVAAKFELWRGDERVAVVPLAEEQDGVWRPASPFVPGVPLGTAIGARLSVRDGARWTVPPAGLRPLEITDRNCLDLGDDDESYLLDGGSSRACVFVNERERCRELAGPPDREQGLTLRLEIPRQAVRVLLDIRLCGAARILAEDRLLHEDRDPPDIERSLRLSVDDRRLWPDGQLLLHVDRLGPLLQVARVRYRAEGSAAEPPPAGRRRHTVAPFASLRVGVLRLLLDDLPCEASRDQIEAAVFGDSTYDRTPPPDAVATTGSVATVIESLSGGATRLQGRMLPDARILLLAADLRGEADAGRAHLEAAVRRALADLDVDCSDLEAILVVHGRGASWPDSPASRDGPALIFLPERSEDGSFMATGDALFALLRRTRGLADHSAPAMGGFGPLVIGGYRPAHLAVGPLAIERERLGWVDRIEFDGTARLELPTLQQDRAFLALSCDRLPGRGPLIIEARRETREESGGEGILVYWDRRDSPVRIASGLREERLRIVRLDPGLDGDSSLLSPASRSDLFRGAFSLDATSTPSAATPEGEVPWKIEVARNGEREYAQLTWTGIDIGPWREASFAAIREGRPPVPVRFGVDLGESGLAEIAPDGVQLRPPADGALAATLKLPRMEGLWRLFARLSADPGAAGRSRARMFAGEREILDAGIGPGERVPLELDLPSDCRSIRFAVDADSPSACPIRLERCTLVQRRPALSVLVAPPSEPARSLWMDGAIHSIGLPIELDDSGRYSGEFPVILGRTPARLRIVAGAADLLGPASFFLTCSVSSRESLDEIPLVSDLHLERRAGRQPIWTILVDLPARPSPEMWMLRIGLRGAARGAFWIQSAEIEAR